MTTHSPGKPLPPLRPLTSAERAMVERSFAEGANLRETMLLVGVPHFDTYSKPLAEKVAALRAAGATWDAIARGTGIDIGHATARFIKSLGSQGIVFPRRPAPMRDNGPVIGECPRCGRRITIDGGYVSIGGQRICPGCASRRYRGVNRPHPDSPYPGE